LHGGQSGHGVRGLIVGRVIRHDAIGSRPPSPALGLT
jgi:hypothetical protein